MQLQPLSDWEKICTFADVEECPRTDDPKTHCVDFVRNPLAGRPPASALLIHFLLWVKLHH